MNTSRVVAHVVEALESRRMMAADTVLQWNEILLDAIRAERTPPPSAARNMAIVHAAVFDAVNAIARGYEPYLVHRRGPRGASLDAAAAQAAHDTLASLYASRRSLFDSELSESLAHIADGPAETQGIAVGRAVARQVLAMRSDDGADAVVEYSPGTDASSWVPTPPGMAPALFPQWPAVEPFAMESGAQFRPGSPPDITSEAFAASLDQVKRLGAAGSTERTAYQTDTALLWADGPGTATPPGHWNIIAAQVAEARGHSLVENARMFALLNVALADAGIVAWDSKYAFNLCRPITAIRNAADDGNPLTEPDAEWSPLITTPPFPSYTSGHSTFSAAAATVLAGVFGSDAVSFTTAAEGVAHPIERTFGGFWEAAEDAGISRIYGGIHYDFDNDQGLQSGQALGTLVAETLMRPTGTRSRGHAPAREDGHASVASGASEPITASRNGTKPDRILVGERDVLARTFGVSRIVLA